MKIAYHSKRFKHVFKIVRLLNAFLNIVICKYDGSEKSPQKCLCILNCSYLFVLCACHLICIENFAMLHVC